MYLDSYSIRIHRPNHHTRTSPRQSTTFIRFLLLVEEAKDLSSNVLAAGLLVVHDASGGGQDDETELTRGEQLDNPLLEITELDVVAGADDTGLVETVHAKPSVFNPISSIRRKPYRPLSWMTILPARWSSISSNSPM